jgi:glycosyltransferase involved in cell wall biosynthesis
VVVPAYNEERLLSSTLAAMGRAVEATAGPGRSFELIVVDNGSTDRTAALAREAGARVVHEPHRQIARARNGGAAVAGGDWLLFIDADCWPSPGLLAQAWEAMASGRVIGGGSTVGLDSSRVPAIARVVVGIWNALSRGLRLAAGSFLFCRADAFRALGGFDEALYASEELDMSRRLKRLARREGTRFVILAGHPLITSARKVHLYTPKERARFARAFLRHPRRFTRDRDACAMWYDGRR